MNKIIIIRNITYRISRKINKDFSIIKIYMFTFDNNVKKNILPYVYN